MPVVHNLNVLVVDDQPSMRGLTKVCLKRLGIDRITDAGTGREALDAMNKQRFDLVISDWLMPDMDGVEFVKKVRGHPILGRTPFIMTSTRELDDEMHRGRGRRRQIPGEALLRRSFEGMPRGAAGRARDHARPHHFRLGRLSSVSTGSCNPPVVQAGAIGYDGCQPPPLHDSP